MAENKGIRKSIKRAAVKGVPRALSSRTVAAALMSALFALCCLTAATASAQTAQANDARENVADVHGNVSDFPLPRIEMPTDTCLDDDTLVVSLMTCAPGPMIYELYGHTAIRIIVTTTGEDLSFNYGIFDQTQPNFIMNFLLGRTDYMLGVRTTEEFLYDYDERGIDVFEQKLDLSPDEKSALFYALAINAQPENCTYRYNFLYDNCTSQARDKIEQCLAGQMVYPADTVPQTFRDIIHIYTQGSPWMEFGQDLLLGAAADVPASQHEKMFAPFFFKKYLDEAIVRRHDGTEMPIVCATDYYKAENECREVSGFFLPPAGVFGLLLAITAAVCAIELRRKKICLVMELLLMLVQGLAGCIIALLFFFSDHPTVGSNWLIAILNPIPLIYAAVRARKLYKRRYDAYAPAALAVETLFLAAMPFIPQYFSASVYCFALSLCLHSGTCTYIQHKLKWKKTA